jgi:hypothetical protein
VNKTDPNGVVEEFIRATNSSLLEWKDIDRALGGASISLRRKAAADAFMAVAGSWESFLSSWIVSAVNKDASQARATLEANVRRYATNELRIPSSHLTASVVARSHFTLAEVRQLLDPNDYNIMARDHKELRKRADTWLAGLYRQQARSVTALQFKPVLITRLVRNALAHRSAAALREANDVVREANTPLDLRYDGVTKLNVAGWRRYLLATHGDATRIEHIHTRPITTASLLKVT